MPSTVSSLNLEPWCLVSTRRLHVQSPTWNVHIMMHVQRVRRYSTVFTTKVLNRNPECRCDPDRQLSSCILIYSFIQSFVSGLIRSFTDHIYQFINSSIRSFIHIYIYWLTYLKVCLYFCLLVYLSMYSFVHVFIYWTICLSVCFFMYLMCICVVMYVYVE